MFLFSLLSLTLVFLLKENLEIDYALGEALTQYGLIGIKVWICRGEVYGKRDLMLHFKSAKQKVRGVNKNNNRKRK